MRQPRSSWRRVLRLYGLGDDAQAAAARFDDPPRDTPAHARSRFRSAADPRRFALYCVHDSADGAVSPPGEHTLIAVREFRRVPLDASSLALTVFTARPGCAVPVVAALAHFVERAVDLYQPGYLLLAHSLEAPRISLLLMAVRDALALAAGGAAAFSLDELMVELDALLDAPPERYEYSPEAYLPALTGAISPYAV